MTLELDHLFILTDPGAPSAELLINIGLIEGTRNDHPGQGTANRRFFFSNAVLELLYLRDVSEAANSRASRLRFQERANNTNASPFGLISKTVAGTTVEPFPGWRYCPPYFQADQCFHVGENSDLLEEPLCICMPQSMPLPKPQRQPENPLMTLSEVRISVPITRPSSTLQTFAKNQLISLQLNKPHGMELIFNEAREGRSKELMPELPLLIRW